MKNCEALITHPYLERRGKHIMLVYNADEKSVEVFMTTLDIAEKMCTCDDKLFKKLLPIFKEAYSLTGDANAEIRFIKEQRNNRK